MIALTRPTCVYMCYTAALVCNAALPISVILCAYSTARF